VLANFRFLRPDGFEKLCYLDVSKASDEYFDDGGDPYDFIYYVVDGGWVISNTDDLSPIERMEIDANTYYSDEHFVFKSNRYTYSTSDYLDYEGGYGY